MLNLVAKTIADVNQITELTGRNNVQNLSYLERAEMVHTFWCIAMPCGQLILKVILESGVGYVTIEGSEQMYVSANTIQWHTIARSLLSHSLFNVKKFGTLLVQSYPEIFKGLSTTIQPNGLVALR